MPKIICDWMMCKYNSSKIYNVAGECTKDEIALKHFDWEDEDDCHEGLQCESFERDYSDGYKEKEE